VVALLESYVFRSGKAVEVDDKEGDEGRVKLMKKGRYVKKKR